MMPVPPQTFALANSLATLQREVQRKLGRCMIRLQQYELGMKAMVANMVVEGPPAQLQAIRDQQVACASTKTLGTLVGKLTGSYLAPAVAEGAEHVGDAETGQQPPGEMWFEIRHQIALPPDRYERIKRELAELVAMRNELVHHFLERFDLGQEAGCRAGEAYLDACFEKIDAHYLTLKSWAKAMDESRESMAAFMRTPEFVDFCFHGIFPDGAVQWASSTIVTCLRNAEQACAVNGWTLLDRAIAHIRTTHPDHTPARYGCKSWRQVLKKSEQFEIRTDTNPLTGAGQAWYRSREEAAMNHDRAS